MQLAVSLLGNAALYAGIFALVNLGVVLLYRATGVLSFAQGYLLMLGAYFMSTVSPKFGYWAGLGLTIAVVAAVGWITYLVIGRLMVGSEEFSKAMCTFLIAALIAQGVSIGWGTNTRIITEPEAGGLHIGQGVLPWTSIGVLAVAVLALYVVFVILHRSTTGLRMRALAQDESLAIYSGMNVHRLAAISWAIAGAVAAIAGVAYAQTTAVSFSLSDVGLLAFPAAVIGGLTSLGGSMVGAVLLAGVTTIAEYNLNSSWASLIEYAFMLVALGLFPFGIFGKRAAQRL